ncbi:MAG: hypothetical protein Q9227_009442 [Pyrenula ochraceoflavens]
MLESASKAAIHPGEAKEEEMKNKPLSSLNSRPSSGMSHGTFTNMCTNYAALSPGVRERHKAFYSHAEMRRTLGFGATRPNKLVRNHSSQAASKNNNPQASEKGEVTNTGSANADSSNYGPAPKIDPLSRQILKRTTTARMIPQAARNGAPPETEVSSADKAPAISVSRSSTNVAPVSRVDTTGNKLQKEKDKKKGVSFLSRFIGTKRKDSPADSFDNVSESTDNRPTGMDAELFSQPIGFMPRFPAPPKYIKVRAQNRKEKDFDKVFLAQLLQGTEGKRKRSSEDAETSAHPAGTNPSSSKAVWAMKFSKDGQYLAAAGQDKIVRVWAVMSSQEERQAFENEEDGKSGNEDTSGMKLNAPVFKTKLVREYDGHTSSVLDLSWSKNNFLLSSSMDKTVRLWHVSRQECLCAFKHSDFVTSIQFHPRDDRFFLAGSLDSKLRLWSIPDKSVAFWAQVPDMVTAVAFTPDGRHSIAGCLNGLCIFYDTEGLRINAQIHVRSARGRNAKGSKITGIDTISLPKDNTNSETKILITSNDSRVRMYNFKDRQLEIKFRGNENSCSQIHATFSDDGKYVICGSEDRKVYIWPTGPVENDKEPDKRPVEIFEAHSAIVTTAILAPTTTRQLLSQSGDPIYDICNPPPVTLLSRSESVISSKAGTEAAPSIKDGVPPTPRTPASRINEEKPSYVARSSHPGGNIIVTADFTGTIKVFRQDCAALKRRSDSWESGSVFSKKILNRSSSIATRTSATSHRRRTSITKNGNVSNDRILNWRNSVAAPGTPSQDTLRSVYGDQAIRTRSISPRKSLGQFSTKSNHRAHNSTPLISSTAAPSSRSNVSPPPSLHKSSAGDSPSHPSSSSAHTPPEAPSAERTPTFNKNDPTTQNPPSIHINNSSTSGNNDKNPLMLIGNDHSLRYWDREAMSNMAHHQPRTPSLSDAEDRDAKMLKRKESIVSALSSDGNSDSGSDSGGENRNRPAKSGR